MSFVFVAVCSVLFLSPSTHAYSLSISADDVYVEITSGETSVKKADIEVTTNCRAGYNFSISTTTSPSLYLNGNGNSSAVFTAVNGTNALSNSANQNKWGYYYNSNQSTVPTDSSTFLPLSTTQTTLRTPSQTASPSSDIDDDFSIYYGVNAGASVAPGLYYMANSGKINYYATADTSCDVVNIAYDGNNATAGTMGAVGTGVIHTGVKDGDTIDLIASNFNKTGYGFAGWSLDPNAGAKLIDNNSSNNPIVYGSQETVTLPQGFINNDTDNDGIVKLYAVWIPSQGNLQGWTGCANLDTATYDSTTGALDLTKNSVTALTDQRDNQVYAVARLADGKCWMIENLRLDNNATTPNWGDDFLSQGFGGVFTGLANPEAPALFKNVTTANSLYYSGTQSSTATINIGTSGYPAYRMPRYNNINTSARASSPTANSEAMYGYGNYYTWAAAIADTAAHATNNTTVTNASLCPAGWHLPTGGSSANASNSEFWQLGLGIMGFAPSNNSTYQSSETNTAGKTVIAATRSYPNNFVSSGYNNKGTMSDRGSGGAYWSSTVSSSDNAYSLYLYPHSPTAAPGTFSAPKYNGYVARCVASDPETFTLTYNANGGSGAPSSQSTTANGSATFTISSTTPTRSGYTFAGWIDENGNEASAGGTFRTKDTNVTLYARWTNNSCNPSATTIGTGNSSTDAVCLQDVKPSMKSSLPTATASTGTYNLIDARDGQSYTVAKLPDDNLWLTKNLNYGNSSDTLLTAYDTDIPSNTTFMSPASTSTFLTGTDYYTTPQIQSNVTTYGGYYSYAAAIASTTAYSTANQNITTSICPKGWDLPTSASYTYLKSSASLTNYATASVVPYSFTYGGYKNGANFTNQTTRGDLWTSTNYAASLGQELYITSLEFNILANNSINNKYYGRNVRCIASNGTATVNYDANGGSGTMASQTGDINSIAISSNTFTAPTGYQFKNWNTATNGSGTTVTTSTALSSIASNGDTVTLYAQWNPIYKITYVNNCATFNTGCTTSTSNGQSIQNIILANNPSTGTETGTLYATNNWTQTNYKITSWNTAADGSGTSYVPSSTYTVPAGSVPGDGITLYAQWTPKYIIVFDGNGATNAMTGMRNSSEYSVKYTNVGGGDEIELLAPNYYKTGYGFAGWSFDSSATPGGLATIYGPSETITAPVSSTPGETKTLYAIWVASSGTMQNWNGCSSMNVGDVTALNDIRDSTNNNVYTVGKLEDGNCWMMENLRLDTANSSDNTKAQGFGGVFTGLAASESSNFSNSTTANTLYSTTNITGSNQAYRFPRYNNSNTANKLSEPSFTRSYANTASPSNSGTYYTSTVYSYGNYYTWAAAMANTKDIATRVNTENAGTSICPAGWRLPTGGNYNEGTNEFYNLTTTISGPGPETGNAGNKYWYTAANAKPVLDALKKFPNNYVYSGYYSGSNIIRGSNGYYWSTTAENARNARILLYESSRVLPGTGDVFSRYLGHSVRCISSTYTVTLNGNGATTAGSSSTTVGLGATTLGTITNPQKSYSVSGWTTPSGNNASGATVNGGTAPGTLNSNYTLNGWYKESATTNLIASGATTPVLQANTDYTDANSKWTNKGNVTLYAGWTSQSVTLPTITKAGYDCGWTTTSTGATSITYSSGGSFTPSANTTLYGVCVNTGYTIVFDGNGSDNDYSGMTDGMNNYTVQFTNVGVDDEIQLLAPNYYRTGYGFAGWSVDYTGATMPIFGPNETTTLADITQSSTPGSPGDTIVLYAIWVQSTGYMQSWKASDCADLVTEKENDNNSPIHNPLAGITALSDIRDESVYTVGALADGNCWMMENLRLNNNSNTPNWGDNSYSQGFGGVFTGLAGSEAYSNFGTTNSNSLYSTSNITGSYQYMRFPRYNNTNTTSYLSEPYYTRDYADSSNPTSTGSYPEGNIYSYGNMYSWAAAMANTTSVTTITASEAANTSICPYGWQLPYGRDTGNGATSGGFGYLFSMNNSNAIQMRKFPNNFVYSGENVNGSDWSGGGLWGVYWSHTAYNGTNTTTRPLAYEFIIDRNDDENTNPHGTNNKTSGFAIRCLIKQ